MPRIELRDGQWAELREHITHGADKRIKRAYVAGRREDADVFEAQTAVVREFTKSWNILDPDGAAIPLDAADAFDRMPDDIVDVLFAAGTDLWKEATTPGEMYSRLIGRLVMGQRVSEAEIEQLPEPDTFKDALLLATEGRWSPKDLDDTDALLLSLIQRIRNAKRG